MKIEDAYIEYRSIYTTQERITPIASYNWYEHPDIVDIQYMAYIEMLKEFSTELSNITNQLGRFIHSLRCWDIYLQQVKDQNVQLNIIIEFIEPIATLALNLPYVVRSRFVYAITHLSHQANKSIFDNWVDDLPLDNDIYFSHADKYSSNWKSYKRLKVALERISDKVYQKETSDFRNKYNHRYSPHIEIGLSEIVKRKKENDGHFSYSIGQTDPIKLKTIIKCLTREHVNTTNTYSKFKKLVEEQLVSISFT